MNKMNSKKIYIILFIILYLFVAIVSGIHGFAFFGLANTPLLATMLTIAFEIGQAAVLFSILTDKKQQKKAMPWILMSILTLVQIMGNVYNSYKFLISNAGDNLRFFKEPIFVWTQLPDTEANVILSYIQGAILPIVALLLTAMVSSFLNKKEDEFIEFDEEEPEEQEEDGEKEYVPSEEEVKPSIEDYEDYKEDEEHRHHEEVKNGKPNWVTIPSDEIIPVQPMESPNDYEQDDNPEDKANDEYVEHIEEEPQEQEVEPEHENVKSHFINI